MSKPIILDLFCGAGGASMGYYTAGFDVVGVDISPQIRYPFEFIQADWKEPLAFLLGKWDRRGLDFFVHASPPCQRYSSMTKKWGRSEEHPDLISEVRNVLKEYGVNYVIENVVGAPLINPVMLCGSMFNLGSGNYQLRRHRLFESNVGLYNAGPCTHWGQPLSVYGHAGGKSNRDSLDFPSTNDWKIGMDIEWMIGKELAQAIPPAYTNYIGKQLLQRVGRVDV